jgi:hypothetical protein
MVSADPATGVAPLDVRFSADYGSLTGAISTLSWAFSDGSTVMAPTAQRHYDAPTQEHAVFTVTDDKGLTGSAFVDVVIANTAGQRPTLILSQPRTSIFTGEEYTYNKGGVPTVRGNPPFTYSLVKGPTDATIDAMTGRITWTPTTAGDVPFELRVVGQDGPAVQEWTVMVVSNASMGPSGGGCRCDAGGGLLLLLGLVPLVRRRRRGFGAASTRTSTHSK